MTLSLQTLQTLTPVATADGLQLPLARLPSLEDRGSVLLLHGASAGSDTFLTPQGRGLADHLARAGFDVWLLDWRGGRVVTESFAQTVDPERFTLDAAAEHDFAPTLARMRDTLAQEGRKAPLHIVAHCMGAGALSMAIAAHDLARAFGVERVVLLTLGLFYQQSIAGFIKAEDHVLERIDREDPGCRSIHPDVARYPWPETLEAAFALYPRALLPKCGSPICERLSFMFGTPFEEANLAAGVHEGVAARFGAIHRTLYMQCGQHVRRGVASRFGEPVTGASSLALLDTRGFRNLRVTLVTGARNQLWHRDSIDRMHEYLSRAQVGARSQKHVLPGYGHQDLLWGEHSARDVFPRIVAGLAPAAGEPLVYLRSGRSAAATPRA